VPSQVVQQRAVSHVLGHNEDRSILTADSVQLDQIGMLQFPTIPPPLTHRQLANSNIIYVMTFASSMKSSSDIVPSFIIFTATSIEPLHLPLLTTPNWPLPSSSSSISSVWSISHLSERVLLNSGTYWRGKN
jgi:hypothetical protein